MKSFFLKVEVHMENVSRPFSLMAMPPVPLALIASYLACNPKDRIHFALTCKKANKIVKQVTENVLLKESKPSMQNHLVEVEGGWKRPIRRIGYAELKKHDTICCENVTV
jgi:hypothetical protein